MPLEVEIGAFHELAEATNLAESWEKITGIPFPRDEDDWFELVGRGDIPVELFVSGKIRPRQVLSYLEGRRAQQPDAGADNTVNAEVKKNDEPDERGYVESPTDPTAYVPATDILTEHTPAALSVSMKELGTILEDYHVNRIRWTRPLGKSRQPMRNRRSVHLGDWTAYVKRRVPADADGFPRLSEAELESRKAAVRNSKHAGK